MNDQLIPQLKALADPNRLVILTLLSRGELCACQLLEHLHITQPTLSHHMRQLTQSGLVSTRQDGKWMHYALNPGALSNLIDALTLLVPLTTGPTPNACLCSRKGEVE